MYPRRVDAPTALVEALADRYRVDRQLGAGGMATVYLAHDHKHDREVAIKVLRPDLAETLGRERFLREIQLAARLNHPNILPLYDSGDSNGCMYFVMPVMEGQTLRDRLSSGSPLPVDEAVRIAVEVADALDYAHRRDIVHRDIKPENILLHEGHAVVADFGIGKALVAASAATGVMSTQIGVTVGTPAYMSPEQAAGGDLDGRSDLFALGCVMFEMLTGEIAFTGPSADAVIARRFAYSPPPITDSRPEIPAAVGETVSRLLQRSADDWFATGSQVVAALWPRPTPPVATAAVAPDRARRDSSIVRVTSTDRSDVLAGAVVRRAPGRLRLRCRTGWRDAASVATAGGRCRRPAHDRHAGLRGARVFSRRHARDLQRRDRVDPARVPDADIRRTAAGIEADGARRTLRA